MSTEGISHARTCPTWNARTSDGIHVCVGSALVRLTLRVALELLLERLPNLHLTPMSSRGVCAMSFCAATPHFRGEIRRHSACDL